MSKKLLPPRWDEKHQRWQKDCRFSGFRKSFYSKCKSEKTATKDIALQIENWKDSLDGLSMYGKMSPMSTVENIYHKGFKQDLEERTSQSNWRPAENRIEHHVLPFIGKMRIMDLNDGILQRVISKAYQSGLSKKTIRSIKGDMTSLVKYCRKLKLTKYRPEDIDIPVSAPKSEKSILQPSDLQILFSVDTSRINGQIEIEPYVYGYRLQVLHGLRPGEIGGLRKSDRIGDIVRIQRARNAYNEITSGKNDNAIRAIQLCPLAIECWDKLSTFSSSDWLFPEYTSRKYYHHLQNYCKTNNITLVSPYELRHTAISIMQALPEGLVKSTAGHSKSMDTFGVYGHSVDGDLNLTATLLQNRFTNILSQK